MVNFKKKPDPRDFSLDSQAIVHSIQKYVTK